MIAAAAGDTARDDLARSRTAPRSTRKDTRQGRDAADVCRRRSTAPSGEAAARARRRSQGDDQGGRPVRADGARRRSACARQRRQRRAAAGADRPADVAGATRGYRYNELISSQGGLTALHFAARQGYIDTVKALVDGGADINQLNAGDKTSPLLIAIINGHFDLAKYLLEKGANPNAAASTASTPLFAVLNIQWAPKSLYPSPKAYQQQTDRPTSS